MNDLINISEDLTVSSREVAEKFGKEHKNVVQAIENKIQSLTAENSAVKISGLFVVGEYEHRGNVYKEYHLTRDGFSFIVMGFTGSKADIWKLKFIDAFNKMEETIKTGALPQSKQKRPALGSVNVAVKNIMSVYKDAEVDPRFTATAVTKLYEEMAGIKLIPPIQETAAEMIYEKEQIAELLGIVSDKGLPHKTAIGAIISKLEVSESEIVKVPYTNRGHSGFHEQFKPSVVDKIKRWLEENNFPQKIEGYGKSYTVKYLKVA